MPNTQQIEVPHADISPRIDADGVIYWYQGDTFKIDFEIKLLSDDDPPVEIPLQDGDTVRFTFRDYRTRVAEFVFDTFQDGVVTLEFDAQMTAKFCRGEYTYDVTHERDYIRTIIKDNKAVVE